MPRRIPAVVVDRTAVDERNYFLDTAADEALTHVDSSGRGSTNDLIVHTTLLPRLEDAARKAVAKTLNAKGRKMHASEAAVVIMKPDGAVAALLGGRDYDESVFNRATQAKRQPGSAFKPFVYLAALENGITPNDVRDDGPVDIDGWTPTNYGGRSYGTVTLAEALAHSINTVTAGLAQEVGVTTVVDAAHRCGITSPLTPNASLALGTSEVTPMELTTAYATFASGGYRVYPYFVTEVDDAGGHALYKRTAPTLQRVIASPRQSRSDRHALWRRDRRHRTRRRHRGPRSRRQDRHDAGLSRRLVRRLHGRLCDERVGRQRQFHADEIGDGRKSSRRHLARHDDGGGARDAVDAAR